MKGVIQMGVLVVMLIVGLPLVIGLSFGDGLKDYGSVSKDGLVETPSKIKVWIEEEQRTRNVSFEEYVCSVVASEMPISFEEEALKAQAIAVRTYAMSKLQKFYEAEPADHPKAAICNTTHCQVYKSKKTLLALHINDWDEDSWEKIESVCKSTEGELLYYNGELVTEPLFFSSSGGLTENSEDVFSGAYPYLVSVASPYEEGATHANEEKSFEVGNVETILNNCYTDRYTGSITKANTRVLSRTSGGRVREIRLGESIYTGTEVRSALELSSALFYVSFTRDGNKIIFTTNGYGHGVGMSQYGANGMAKEGKTYKEILAHYYTGTEVY
ncbi:MAG: stage II sporulation protein D [Firmicutes bacterium]|nr:stage II sporulation protein D [Bacillota bacterium]